MRKKNQYCRNQGALQKGWSSLVGIGKELGLLFATTMSPSGKNWLIHCVYLILRKLGLHRKLNGKFITKMVHNILFYTSIEVSSAKYTDLYLHVITQFSQPNKYQNSCRKVFPCVIIQIASDITSCTKISLWSRIQGKSQFSSSQSNPIWLFQLCFLFGDC